MIISKFLLSIVEIKIVNVEDFNKADAPGRVLRHPNGYWAFIPHPLPPDIRWSVRLVTALSRADRALGELAGLAAVLPNPNLLIQPLIRREAVLSSRIEGTHASLGDLYAFEAVQLTLFELPEDVKEVRNYVRALQYGLERLSSLPVSLRLIRELHARLLDGVRGEQWTPGQFRSSQNWIGAGGSTIQTATYVPPPVAEMNQALGNLEKFIHQQDTLPPLIRLALVHYQFEAIHPFLDGNGRVGRLLNNLLLQDWDLLSQPVLYLSAYFEAARQAYYNHLLAVSQQGAWVEWFEFFLYGVQIQAKDSIRRIQRLQSLRDTYRDRFQQTRSTARLLQVIDWLFVQPIFNIPQLSDVLAVNYPAAQRYVTQLEKVGIIVEITGQARNRIYRADGILAAVEE
jgi:cell filamentation protein, protein adenylyltransferase